MNYLDYWNLLRQPPPDALKPISGGRLAGKTDINPQWRMEIMTATFGVCGIGWKYVIKRLWREDGIDREVFAFAEIDLFVKIDSVWSEPIPGIGGSMLVEIESKGVHCSDEGYKMAVTDALSVAFKAIGVGADVYRGKWDGTKYKDSPPPYIAPPPSKLIVPLKDYTKMNPDTMNTSDLQAAINTEAEKFPEKIKDSYLSKKTEANSKKDKAALVAILKDIRSEGNRAGVPDIEIPFELGKEIF